jgi:hypothetical protein
MEVAMFDRLIIAFCGVDNWLFDHIFQPIVDWFAKTFGVTHRIPEALSIVIGCILFLVLYAIRYGIFVLIILASMYNMIKSIHVLVQEEMAIARDRKLELESNPAMNSLRVSERYTRAFLIVYCIGFLPIVSFVTDSVPVSVGFVCFCVGLIGSFYFSACIDLPPGKTTVQKVGAWLRDFAQPLRPHLPLVPIRIPGGDRRYR